MVVEQTSDSELGQQELAFIEDVALLWEKSGATRMAGRILALLMISDPPQRTATAIASALHASKASISTNLRMYVDLGLVDRLTLPPDRRTYYRMAPGSWLQTMERALPLLGEMQRVAERGLRLVEGSAVARRQVQGMLDFARFYEYGVRDLITRWRAGERAAELEERPVEPPR